MMSEHETRIADFENPPVVETVLSVQFAPLKGFTSGHFGWFWKQYLDENWVETAEVPALPDQFERFEDDSARVSPTFRLVVRHGPVLERLQIIHRDDDRVIQVQNSRFLYNWRKREGEYPLHFVRVKEFHEVYSSFCRFLIDAGLEEPEPNQWQVTYINHVVKGEGWDSPADWHELLPGLVSGWSGFSNISLESVSAEWHHEIEPQRGRLHVALKHLVTTPPESNEVMVLDLTARGPLYGKDEIDSGFACGRRAIVETFVEITSDKIRVETWKQVT